MPHADSKRRESKEEFFRKSERLSELARRSPDPPVKNGLDLEHFSEYADAEKDEVPYQHDDADRGPIGGQITAQTRARFVSTFFCGILLLQFILRCEMMPIIS